MLGFCSSMEFSFSIYFIFKPIIIFSTFIPVFVFPTVLFPLQLIFSIFKYSYLPLFNLHICSLFFLFFPLNIFVSFIFIALFLNWHLALVLFSSLCFR